MRKLGIYISNYNTIGGVERFAENITKRLSKHYKITFLFDWCEDYDMVFELSKYADIVKIYKSVKYNFDYFINSTAWGFCPYDNVDAEKVIQVVHADYRHVISNWNFKYIKHPKTTHHVCVGEIVKEAFEEVTGLNCDAVIYNLLDNTIEMDKKEKNESLHLVTLSRLSGEKGFTRMKQFSDLLDKKGIDYIWNVYGNLSHSYAQQIKSNFKNNKNVIFKGVTREPFKEINKADYLVQLSDTEGFAYSVYEAMQTKTPCIITPFLSGKEQITDGINGYIIPFDMRNIDLNKIINNIPVVPDFKELGKESDWVKLFEDGKN